MTTSEAATSLSDSPLPAPRRVSAGCPSHLESPAVAVLRLELALDERPQAAFRSSSALPTRSWLVMAMVVLFLIRSRSSVVPAAPRQRAVQIALRPSTKASRRDLRPALHQAVVGHGFGEGALLALAQGVEAVAEFAGGFGLAAEFGDQRRRRAPRRRLRARGSVMHHFPDGEARGRWSGPSRRAVRRACSRRTLPALETTPGCRPRPGHSRWCSWTWKAVRRRRNRPRQSRSGRTRSAPSGCRRRSRLPARPALRRGSG
jgi:hypothetical protein